MAPPRSARFQFGGEAIPQKMAGIRVHQTGGPEQLRYETDLDVPEIKEGEVLVRNEFINVNFADTYVRSGPSNVHLPLPTIPGREAAGVVVASAVSPSDENGNPPAPGTRVAYLQAGLPCYAEYTAVPVSKVVTIPDGLATEQAAAGLQQGLMALTLVRVAAGIRGTTAAGSAQNKGEAAPLALVRAASRGVPLLLVQILAASGVRVIGTAGTAERCETVRAAGAEWVLESRGRSDDPSGASKDPSVKKVGEITGGRGVDFIFDNVGLATFETDLVMAAHNASLIFLGFSSGHVPPVDIEKLTPKNLKLMRPGMWGEISRRESYETYSAELFDMMLAGKVNIPIDKIYPLENASESHAVLESGQSKGKLLLKP